MTRGICYLLLVIAISLFKIVPSISASKKQNSSFPISIDTLNINQSLGSEKVKQQQIQMQQQQHHPPHFQEIQQKQNVNLRDNTEHKDASTRSTWIGPQSGTGGIQWMSITSDSNCVNLAVCAQSGIFLAFVCVFTHH